MVFMYANRSMFKKGNPKGWKSRKTKQKSPWGYVPRNIRNSGLMSVEKKYFDTARANILPVNFPTGNFDPLTVNTIFAPIQGTGASDRTGTRTLIHSVHINFEFRSELITDSGPTARLDPTVYIALVLDKQTNATQPAPVDVWDAPSSAQQDLLVFRKIENSQRFKVLWKTVQVANTTLTQRTATNFSQTGARIMMTCNKYFKNPIVCRHIGNGGTIGDIAENSLHVFAWVRDSAHSDQLIYNARVRFTG